MPNHISNKLKVVGETDQILEVMNFIKSDKDGIGTIDFNKITPMPKWIYGSSPDVIGIGRDDYEKWGKENTSLDWAIENWGTKWNAYGQPDKRRTDDTIYFETAWSGVPDLIQKIAWIFPDVTLEYSFADEDLGSGNNGIYHFRETEIIKKECYPSRSKEAYELGFDLVNHGEVYEDMVFDEKLNTYVWIED